MKKKKKSKKPLPSNSSKRSKKQLKRQLPVPKKKTPRYNFCPKISPIYNQVYKKTTEIIGNTSPELNTELFKETMTEEQIDNDIFESSKVEINQVDGVNNEEEEDIEYEGIDVQELYTDYMDDDKELIEKVQIYGTPNGYTILPIVTDEEGRLKFSGDIKINPIHYKEKKFEDIVTSNEYRYSPSFDIKNEEVTSFIVINRSQNNSVIVYLENSPDNHLFENDEPQMMIEPTSFKVLTPTRFVRYQRIAFRSALPNHPSKIDIYYQAQGNAETT